MLTQKVSPNMIDFVIKKLPYDLNEKFSIYLARSCRAGVAVGKIGRIHRKLHGKATRQRCLSGEFDVGV